MEPSVDPPTGGFSTRAVMGAVTLPEGEAAWSLSSGRDAGWDVADATLDTAERVGSALGPGSALGSGDTVVFVETIANPAVTVSDLPAIADVCRARGVALVVDNTFAAPDLCRPLDHGVTAVVESATTFRGGHGDVVAGIVVGDAELIARVRHASASALAVAGIRDAHTLVERVPYPGQATHPRHDAAALAAAGLGAGTVRLSLGVEDVEDLAADVRRGLVAAAAPGEGA